MEKSENPQTPFNWQICVPVNSTDYCVFCTYVVQVKNTRLSTDEGIKARIYVTQEVGDDEQTSKLLRGKIHLGQPQPVRLEAHQKVELDIVAPLSLDHLFVEVEVQLGEAKIDLIRGIDDKVIWQYGEEGDK